MPLHFLTIIFSFATFNTLSVGGEDRVTSDGYAGVRLGMTLQEASAAFGVELKRIGEDSNDEFECHFVTSNGEIGQVFFMLYEARIVRLDIDGKGVLTAAGVGVGSTESEVSDAYSNRVVVTEHPYTGPEGHYLTVEFGSGIDMIFETNGETVERYRVGLEPHIQWIEGCS